MPARYLWLPVAGPKRDRTSLRARLPAALAFVLGHLSRGRRVLVHCDGGALLALHPKPANTSTSLVDKVILGGCAARANALRGLCGALHIVLVARKCIAGQGHPSE